MASNNFSRSEYIYGSEAPARILDEPVRRRIEPQRNPARKAPLTKEEQRKQQQSRYAEANRRKAMRFGGVYTLFLTFAVGVMVFTCTGYISLLNTRTDNTSKITTLKEQLNDLKEANDQKNFSIDTSIDYDYIYKVATEELGMVNASADQVISYTSGESEYVIQYSDVPTK